MWETFEQCDIVLLTFTNEPMLDCTFDCVTKYWACFVYTDNN